MAKYKLTVKYSGVCELSIAGDIPDIIKSEFDQYVKSILYKKEEWEKIVNEHYKKELEEWKNKKHLPIISMIEYFFNLKAKDQKIYIVDESIRKFLGDEKIQELFPNAIISNENVVDNVYLTEIKNQLKKSKQKYKKRKEKRK